MPGSPLTTLKYTPVRLTPNHSYGGYLAALTRLDLGLIQDHPLFLEIHHLWPRAAPASQPVLSLPTACWGVQGHGPLSFHPEQSLLLLLNTPG